MSKVRFGVIGCGSIHSTHCKALSEIEDAELTAVHDVIPEAADKAGETWGAKSCETLEQMWDLVDAVCVCVPSGYHAAVGIVAALAGKHVIVEKPIDVDLEAASRLVETCRKKGAKLGSISQHRFAPEVQKVRNLVQAGDLGEILQCDIYNKWHRTQAYYDSGDWRGTEVLDGGCLMNQCVHYIDMAQWIMGGVESVQGIVRTVARDIESETTAMAFLKYNQGAIGLLQGATICYPGFAERIEIHGTEGTVILEADCIKFLEADPAANEGKYGKGRDARPAGISPDEPTQRYDLWNQNHRAQLADFTAAIIEDREPFIRGIDALEPLKIVRAVYESSRRDGQRVTTESLIPALV